jgi:hypothetical protein
MIEMCVLFGIYSRMIDLIRENSIFLFLFQTEFF